MASNISHDLYHLQRGRWMLAQQYGENDKEGAVQRAREMFASGQFDAVGVMRERYDPSSGSSTGSLVYGNAKTDGVPNLHGRVVKPESAAPERKSRRGPDVDDGGDFDEAPAARGHAFGGGVGPSSGTVFGKFIMVFTISFLLAGGTWFILSRFGFEGSLAGLLGERDLPLKAIIVGFFIYSLIIGPTLISGRDLQAIFYSTDSDGTPQRGGRPATQNRAGPQRAAAAPSRTAAQDGAEDDEDEDEDEDDEDEDDAPPPEPKLDKETAGKLGSARETMVAFFELCLRFINDAELPTKTGKLDPLTTFGCHLYFAGAAEALCLARGLPPTVQAKVLEPCVIAMGRKPDQARTFVEKYDEYLLEPSYNEMFRVGREAMETYIVDERKSATAAGDEDSEGDREDASPPAAAQGGEDWETETDIGIFLLHALEDFATPMSRKDKKKAEGGTISVMFTYIVGLGDLTEEHGEAAGRRVASAHDMIVRQAIRDENGREVKHTGEGIMAAFEISADAVAAAVIMQRGFNAHNLEEGDIPLHVKIGINAGEPIIEGDDIFGTTVQVAARLAQNAVADQILVSTVVREISVGRDLEFASAGAREFKGVAEPVPVFEAVWRQPEGAGEEAGEEAENSAEA